MTVSEERLFQNSLLNSSMFDTPSDLVDSAWLEHGNFAFWLIEELQPRVVVELGTHNGFSYLAFCQSVSKLKLDTKCYAIDSWQGDEHTGAYTGEVLTQLRDLHDQKYSAFSTLMPMLFDEAIRHFADGSIDLLHIDGWHTYSAVKHDFESWISKLSDRAVVLFHDVNAKQKDFGVHEFWNEVKEHYPNFEFDHGYGLGVLIVGKQAPTSITQLHKHPHTVEIRKVFSLLGRGILNSWHKIELREALRLEASIHQELSRNHLEVQGELAKVQQELAKQIEIDSHSENAQIELRGEIEKLREYKQSTEANLQEIQDSFSWRITRPIRVIHRMLSKF
jgi:predicted O-methyltransferase YrrM